jgi:hypothetical protein
MYGLFCALMAAQRKNLIRVSSGKPIVSDLPASQKEACLLHYSHYISYFNEALHSAMAIIKCE